MATHTELESRIAALEALVAAQGAELAALRGSSLTGPREPEAKPIARRALLRTAGATAVGALSGAVLGARPAVAANGDPLLVGQTTISSAPTVAYDSQIATTGYAFTDDASFAPTVPVIGEVAPVVTVQAAVGTNAAILATGVSDGVIANGARYGVRASGNKAAIKLGPSFQVDPHNYTDSHAAGELAVQQFNGSGPATLWFCAAEGTPGTWKPVAGNAQMSTFVYLASRIYDSRKSGGRLSAGQTRLIDLIFISGPPAVRVINVAVTETTGAGYLRIYPASAPSPPSTSAVNWYGPGQTLANLTMTGTDPAGKAKFTAGGSGSIHVVVDLVGYFQ